MKELLAHSAQLISNVHTVNNWQELCLFTARCKHFTTGQEIEKEVVNSFLHAKEVEKKKHASRLFSNASQLRIKNHFSNLFTMQGKEVFKTFISRKGVYQAFALLVNKAVKFTEAFKYTVTLVPLTVATVESTLY